MKVIYKNMRGKLLALINEMQSVGVNGKYLDTSDIIPTVRVSKSFVTDSISREVEDTVLDEIKNSILSNRNGIRSIINGKAVKLSLKRNKTLNDVIDNITVLVDIKDSESLVALTDYKDDISSEDREIELKLTKEDKLIDFVDELINYKPEEVKGESKPKVIEEHLETPNMTPPMIIGAHTGVLWKKTMELIPKNELVEIEDGEYSIDFIRYEMIKHNKIKSYMIPYLCKMDNFIFSNLCDTKEHMDMIPKVWNIIHEEIPKYHRDKSDKKDFTFSDNVTNRIKSYLKEDFGIDLIEPEIPNETKTEVQPKQEKPVEPKVKIEKPIIKEEEVKENKVPPIEKQTQEEEFEKGLKELDEAVKDIESKAKFVLDFVSDKDSYKEIDKIMVRKLKNNGPNKKEMAQVIAAQNEHLRKSVKSAYSGVVKSILIHMQTWDLEDLVAVILSARNETVKLYENGKDKERNRDIIVALQRCALWISEVWRNKQEGNNVINCVEMEENEYLFSVENNGVPWVIDDKTLGMILQFESPNKGIEIVDIPKSEFVKKHSDFMRASGLINPLMHDDLGIIPVESIVKKEK